MLMLVGGPVGLQIQRHTSMGTLLARPLTALIIPIACAVDVLRLAELRIAHRIAQLLGAPALMALAAITPLASMLLLGLTVRVLFLIHRLFPSIQAALSLPILTMTPLGLNRGMAPWASDPRVAAGSRRRTDGVDRWVNYLRVMILIATIKVIVIMAVIINMVTCCACRVVTVVVEWRSVRRLQRNRSLRVSRALVRWSHVICGLIASW